MSLPLRRCRHDRRVAGVCGGLAKYFGVDAGAVRLLWIAFVLFESVGLFLYLAAWVLIPQGDEVE